MSDLCTTLVRRGSNTDDKFRNIIELIPAIPNMKLTLCQPVEEEYEDLVTLPDARSFDRSFSGTSAIMEQLVKHKRYLLSLFSNDIDMFLEVMWKKSSSPLSIDIECEDGLRRLEAMKATSRRRQRLEKRNCWNPHYKCAACKFMYRLLDLDNITVNDPFNLTIGEETSSYHMLIFNDLMPSLEVSTESYNKLTQLLDTSKITSCEPHMLDLADATFIKADKMTSYILISWLIEYILSHIEIPIYREIKTSFICGSEGYVVEKNYKSLPTLLTPHLSIVTTIDVSTVKTIFLQISSALDVLQYYDLIISQYELRDIGYEETLCNYVYDDVYIEAAFTLKLPQMKKASMTWYQKSADNKNPVRVYTSDNVSEMIFSDADWNPDIKTIQVTLDGDIVTVYRLNENDMLTRTRMMMIRNIGYPIYQSSFNTYALFATLMSDTTIRDIVYSNKELLSVWKSLWVPLVYEDMRLKLESLSPSPTSEDIISFLSGLYLRCDATSHLWKYLKAIS